MAIRFRDYLKIGGMLLNGKEESRSGNCCKTTVRLCELAYYRSDGYV